MGGRAGGFERLVPPISSLEVHRARGQSGIEVQVARMPGFATIHAVLAVRFGAANLLLPDGSSVPPGTAHFLEHEMFQMSDGDLAQRFEARGASANAYTTTASTAYFFSSPGDLEPNLVDLLEGLGSLALDAEDVDRERGIIAQEIAMYDDDPASRGHVELMRALYRKHPIRHDIGGTIPSIAQIDLPLLQRVHQACYLPGNQVLVVAGDVEKEAVLALVDRELPGPRRRPPPLAIPPEPEGGVRRRRVATRLDVGRPQVFLGLKERPSGGRARWLERRIEASLVVDLLFGPGGRIETALYGEGWVDETLSATYEAEDTFGHAVVFAEVDDERGFQKRLLRALAEAADRPFGREEVERSKRRAIGHFLRVFNAPEAVAHWLLGQALQRLPLDDPWRRLERARPQALDRRLAALIEAPKAWSIVLPLDEKCPPG